MYLKVSTDSRKWTLITRYLNIFLMTVHDFIYNWDKKSREKYQFLTEEEKSKKAIIWLWTI